MTTYTYNGHTYSLSSASTWTAAQSYAQGLGGNLVTINDQAEQSWLVTTFGSSSQLLWIGYTDQQAEGTFQWINGESSTYTNWDSGSSGGPPQQPDNHNGNEDYVAMGGADGRWNDLPSSLQPGQTALGIVEIASANNLPTGSVTIDDTTPMQGQTLTASHTLADADGLGTITYQWQQSGATVYTGNSYTVTQSDVGKAITVVAGYTDTKGTAESVSGSATSAVLNVNDLPTGSVTITGTPKEGEVLTVSHTLADVDGLGTITYLWKANGSVVGTGTNYTLTSNEAGKTIVVIASYTDNQNTAESVASAATAVVIGANDLPTGSVTIAGVAKQGETLTVTHNLADADGLGTINYQWQANGTVVGTSSSYTLTQAEVGKTIIVVASYTDKQGTAESVQSSATVAVLNVNDVPTGSVTFGGNLIQGDVLTVSNNLADPDGLGAISYQWQANGNNIGTGPSYTLTSNEVGKNITVTAGYTDGLGTAESVQSASLGPVITTIPGFTIIPPASLTTGEDGTTANYTIQLNTAPAVNQDVVVTFTSSDTTEGVIDNPTFTFTSVNYATPQTLTIRGVDDYLDDSNVPYQITAKVSSTDFFYKSLRVSSFNLTNTDDGLDIPLDLYGDQGGFKPDVLTGSNGDDILHGLNMADNLSGGLGNDTIYGGYGSDNLFGNDGNDKLLGEQESDYLDGGSGNDTLDGGDGVDTMIGGVGNDTYYLGYDAIDVITDNGLVTDIDTVIMPYQLTSYTLPSSIENGTIDAGTQASNLTGNDANNILTGNDGDNSLTGGIGQDSLIGGTGNDALFGGTDNDSLTGGNGNDHIEGGSGSDYVDSGDGNDEIVGGDGEGDDIYIGGTGTDTIKYSSAITGISVSLTLGTASGNEINNDTLKSIENIIGGQAGDALNGNTGNNVIDGFTGNDTISGSVGNDTMIGGLGNDTYFVDQIGDVVTETSILVTEIDTVNSSISYTLKTNLEDLTLTGTMPINGTGNKLNNDLTGNAGANILIGGLGADQLTGGLGADQFKFKAITESGITVASSDTIVDFNHLQSDKINLAAIDANTKILGNNTFLAPIEGSSFSGVFTKPGQLYFDQTTHILYGNNDADSAADFSIQLSGVTSVVASDFVL